jgi:cytidylate kinase
MQGNGLDPVLLGIPEVIEVLTTGRDSMPIVTIRGPLGSGAPEIGRAVAEFLHADYIDREIIAGVAARLQRQEHDVLAKEMPPSTLGGRIAEALDRGLPFGVGFEGTYLPAWEIPLDDKRYLQALESVIKELARAPSLVIRGRGSQFILKNYPKTLHILTVAPFEVRLKRVREELKTNEEAAKQEIARFDNSSREFIKRYYHAGWEDPVQYDLTLNTGHLSFQAAVSIVVQALSVKE